MKRELIIILALVFIISMITSFVFHFYFFQDFNKDLRYLSEQEKQKVMTILNKSIDLNGYSVHIGRAYKPNKNFVPVEINKSGIRKHYLVNLKDSKIIR